LQAFEGGISGVIEAFIGEIIAGLSVGVLKEKQE
jgi:hypothetical protein